MTGEGSPLFRTRMDADLIYSASGDLGRELRTDGWAVVVAKMGGVCIIVDP